MAKTLVKYQISKVCRF